MKRILLVNGDPNSINLNLYIRYIKDYIIELKKFVVSNSNLLKANLKN